MIDSGEVPKSRAREIVRRRDYRSGVAKSGRPTRAFLVVGEAVSGTPSITEHGALANAYGRLRLISEGLSISLLSSVGWSDC